MTNKQRDPIFHGGNISAASEQFGIPIDQWLDLSTGISPFAYPIPAIPEKYWTDLPYPSNYVLAAAKQYYLGDSENNQHDLLITSGSQFAIQNLPNILDHLPVLLPSVGYQEHRAAWSAGPNTQHFYNALCIELAFDEIAQSLRQNPKQHLVIINPNNPTGLFFSVKQLQHLNKLQDASASLIVDEAFTDLHPENSMLTETLSPNSIVLRSFGKFFGLAGLRVGSVIADSKIVQSLSTLQGPWAVSGASLFIASEAWQTCSKGKSVQSYAKQSYTEQSNWLETQRKLVNEAYESTLEILAPLFLKNNAERITNKTSLFISYLCPDDKARNIYNFFASRRILLRYVPVNSEQAIIRSSLLDHTDKALTKRLQQAIDTFLSNSLNSPINPN